MTNHRKKSIDLGHRNLETGTSPQRWRKSGLLRKLYS